MSKCLVILSGGMDSTTVLFKMIDIFGKENVEAISFDYNQRHKKELEMAKKSTEKLGVKHTIIPVHNIFSNSALTGDKEVPEGHYNDENMKQTVVPFRNTVFLSIAMAVAGARGIENIAIGTHLGDNSIYPDCRTEYIQVMRLVGLLGDYKKINIIAPFQNTNKYGILKEGIKLGVDYSLTWTCYKGGEKACGKCGSCIERLEAFEKNGLKDPLQYEED